VPVEPDTRRLLLLVEEDPMVRDTIMMMLEDDYDVLDAASAGAALERLRAVYPQPIGMVLLDCLLPAGNVPAVLAAADQLSIPVVLTSGDHTQAQTVDPSRPFLGKPFSRNVLLSLLFDARS
jgi:DNA-binding NtrC family response regulator